jgi:hypothetical protein
MKAQSSATGRRGRLRPDRRAAAEGRSRPGDRGPGAVSGYPVGDFFVAAHSHTLEPGRAVRAGRRGSGDSGQGDREELNSM